MMTSETVISSQFGDVSRKLKTIQDHICHGLENVSGQVFTEDNWSYEHGTGGGRTRVMKGPGEVGFGGIEKGGVNFSAVEGTLNPVLAEKMGATANTQFKATGVSLVIHPANPFTPTVHANVRYFETPRRCWVGGGIDLTPYYPFEEDAVHFHSLLKQVCDRFDESYYPAFKKECDAYFFLPHRQETRGVGGIFFDYLQHDLIKQISFIYAVGQAFNEAYLPIFEKRNKTPYSAKEKDFQLLRRGRYVEFNLVYDRGTLFGFQTNGRTESILMSMPPAVKWEYAYTPPEGSREAELANYLKPRDWLHLEKKSRSPAT